MTDGVFDQYVFGGGSTVFLRFGPLFDQSAAKHAPANVTEHDQDQQTQGSHNNENISLGSLFIPDFNMGLL
jgi:hypothetical protein